ncbi:uncharacterized protein LOC144620307 [Crassostrea virginica]
MEKSKKICVIYHIGVISVYVLKIIFYITILLSDEWAEGKGSNFGVLKYCAHNETSCQKVTDILQTIEARLNTTLAFICISIILTSAWLIISLVLFWSSRLLKKQLAGYTKIFHFGTGLFLVVIDTVTVSVFATGVQELLEAYSLGWTFYCAIALPGLTICFFIPYWISTNESCKDFFCSRKTQYQSN